MVIVEPWTNAPFTALPAPTTGIGRPRGSRAALGDDRLEDVPALQQFQRAVELRVFAELAFVHACTLFRLFLVLHRRLFSPPLALLLELPGKVLFADHREGVVAV